MAEALESRTQLLRSRCDRAQATDTRPASPLLALAIILLAGAAHATSTARSGTVAVFSHFRYSGSQPAYADLVVRPSQYLNPILEGFRPDPSIVRVGADYYLATSSFAYWPGLPIFHSRDLVHWAQVGAAISRPAQLGLDGQDTSGGLYAPDIKAHDGHFYLLGTCLGCGGNFLLTARDPAGPWSDPLRLAFPGIDPSIFFDDDGRAYVLNNGPPEGAPLYDGHRAIWLQELDLASLKLVGPRTVLVNGGTSLSRHSFWIEGPHLIKRDGHYYLICAEGGTNEQHSEVVFRSDTVRGPFVPGPDNPILTQRDLDPARPDPVTSTGHADFVQTPAGDWWAVFLGTRPYVGDLYNTGRETFLLPVTWKDGWPTILPRGAAVPYGATAPHLTAAAAEPPSAGDFAWADDFTSSRLDPRWTWLRTPRETWWHAGGGELRIGARAEPLGGAGQPSFIAVRQAHANAEVEVAVGVRPRSAGSRAGLVAFQDARHFLALDVAGDAGRGIVVRLARRTAEAEPRDGVAVAVARLRARSADTVRLRITARGARYTFSYALPGRRWTAFDAQDGTMLSTHVAGGFTGTMLGLFAVSTAVDHRGPTAQLVTR